MGQDFGFDPARLLERDVTLDDPFLKEAMDAINRAKRARENYNPVKNETPAHEKISNYAEKTLPAYLDNFKRHVEVIRPGCKTSLKSERYESILSAVENETNRLLTGLSEEGNLSSAEKDMYRNFLRMSVEGFKIKMEENRNVTPQGIYTDTICNPASPEQVAYRIQLKRSLNPSHSQSVCA